MSDEATQPPPPPCKHWQMLQIGELCDAVNGRAFKSSEWRTDGVPIIRIENLKDSNAKHNYFDGQLDDRHRVQKGDLLFAWSGTPGTSFGAHIWNGKDAALNQHIFNLRFNATRIDARYLLHALNQQVVEYVRKAQGGVGLAHITKSRFTSSWLPVAPLIEQREIVAAIESHFSRLDAATATLERVQRNLERYRASVLKAAVEGRLVPTEAELAKKEGRTYEPASVLLKRILTERRRRWEEAELAKLTAKGKKPTDDKWKAKYEEPAAPDVAGLPELPEGWCWSTLDLIAEVKGGLAKGKHRSPSESVRLVPYLRVANVQRGYLDLNQIKTIEASEQEITDLALRSGDVLFNEGGDRDKLGRGWVWREELPSCIHQNHVFRARVLSGCLLPELLSWHGNTNGQRYFFDEGKHTTNLASLSLSKLRCLPVPLPPHAEQPRIKAETDRHLSLLSEAELLIRASVLRAARLRQSILKWAFEGRLVEAQPTEASAIN